MIMDWRQLHTQVMTNGALTTLQGITMQDLQLPTGVMMEDLIIGGNNYY